MVAARHLAGLCELMTNRHRASSLLLTSKRAVDDWLAGWRTHSEH